MKNGKYQAGVIGLRMGDHHCKGYVANEYCDLVAVCDTDPKQLVDKKALYNPRIVTENFMDIVNDPEIDVVSIVTPDFCHAEQCIAALRAGKHVLCEKPLTLNLEEAKQIVEATKISKGKFMIGQVCRYAPGFVQAKRLIEEGFIGDLFFVESEYAHNYTSARGVNDWRIDARREPVIGGGCHAIDLLRWIAGEALEVSAYSNHKCFKDWPVDDCTVAIYKFPNEVIGKILVSIGCVRPYTMRSVFYGTKGTVLCDNTNGEIQLSTDLIQPTMPGFMKIPVDIASHNVSAEINDFMDCIVNDKTVEASVFEGARTVAAAWAAVQSAHNGGVLTKVEHIC